MRQPLQSLGDGSRPAPGWEKGLIEGYAASGFSFGRT